MNAEEHTRCRGEEWGLSGVDELPGSGFVVGEDGGIGFCAESVKMNGNDREENQAAQKSGGRVIHFRLASRELSGAEGEGRKRSVHEYSDLWPGL